LERSESGTIAGVGAIRGKHLAEKMAVIVQSEAGPPDRSSGPLLLSMLGVSKNFGKNIVLKGISLEVAEGEFLTILGESGSGKTTLLRIIAGFENSTAGELHMRGARIDSLPPNRRPVNTVFQNYALFPHLSVEENVGYGLRVARRPAEEITARVEQALAMVKMAGYAKSKPSKISGGQQQRVALARALVNRPLLLLLDEPLSALDANLRRQMQVELKSMQRDLGITFIFVTHDQEEAMVMSDRIALLRSGELEQVATPRDIYNRPATAYAAQFIGRTNLLHADVKSRVARCGALIWPTDAGDGRRLYSLRPENIRIATGASTRARFRATLLDKAFHGATELLRIDCGGGQIITVRAASSGLHHREAEFEFTPADAVEVQPSEQRT
jgi:spermidine/putrescine transport system ATP-binding protein